ncbi:Ni/Fe hydrogenase subunit alpha, partial [Nocardia gipuzkoensis]
QTSACNALEQACGIELDPPLAALRRLLYCGEWISSHALHIHLLHLPDFLGYPDAIALAADHRELVEGGLALKKAGNALLGQLGGRAIHPINVRVGGFYRVPDRAELATLREQLCRAMDHAVGVAEFAAGLEFPDLEVDHELLAAHAPDRYPVENGAIQTSTGRTFRADAFVDHVVEHQV